MCSFTFLLSIFIKYVLFFILGKLFLEKTPLNLGLLLKQLVVSISLKGWSRTKKFLSLYLLLAIVTALPLIVFTTEETTG